jgi:hypothetical protein
LTPGNWGAIPAGRKFFLKKFGTRESPRLSLCRIQLLKIRKKPIVSLAIAHRPHSVLPEIFFPCTRMAPDIFFEKIMRNMGRFIEITGKFVKMAQTFL